MTVCRVCLTEVGRWRAVRLGCACRNATMHRACAVAWFGRRNRMDCEVCARPLGAAAVVAIQAGRPPATRAWQAVPRGHWAVEFVLLGSTAALSVWLVIWVATVWRAMRAARRSTPFLAIMSCLLAWNVVAYLVNVRRLRYFDRQLRLQRAH